jgi:phosphoribosylaminoimidazolecarboxamide formyltransferase/IMP cyclohydrolase
VRQGLSEHGYEIVSTGGSAAAIEGAGVPVRRVEDLTGFPEMLDGAGVSLHMARSSVVFLATQCTDDDMHAVRSS